MKIPHDISEVERMITEGIEESINLEYKSADALQNTDGKKKEIAKDVSAMANSAGGIIIYGIKEFDSREKKYLPEKITPIKRTQFSKEQLEQIINNNISPKIENLKIYPISLIHSDEVVYVVEIPQSNTAHQNTRDQRYYRRYNFEAVPMLDYEIRDIMNRVKHPAMKLTFVIENNTYEIKSSSLLQMPTFPFMDQPTIPEKEFRTVYTLKIIPVNNGNVYAQYVNYFVWLPKDIMDIEDAKHLNKSESGFIEFYGENTYRDVVDVVHNPIGGSYNKYGPSRFDPILPSMRGHSDKIMLTNNPLLDEREISWTVYADNASPCSGSIRLNEIKIIEQTEMEEDDE